MRDEFRSRTGGSGIMDQARQPRHPLANSALTAGPCAVLGRVERALLDVERRLRGDAIGGQDLGVQVVMLTGLAPRAPLCCRLRRTGAFFTRARHYHDSVP